MKLLCFHPALAPYRIDFFNLLAKKCEMKMMLLQKNLKTQKFEQRTLLAKCEFVPEYMLKGFDCKGRMIRFGALWRILKEKPDIVVGYEASPLMMELCLLKPFFKWKLWTSMDDSPSLIEKRSGLRRFVRDWVIRRCDGVIVPSDEAIGVYHSALRVGASTKLISVPIIYDEKKFRRDEKIVFDKAAKWRSENLKDDERAVFFVGRLSPEKNLKWLVERVADRRWPKNTRLFLVGGGPRQESLATMVQELGLDETVRFCGREEGLRLQTYFASADLFILPSLSETFGAVVSESLHWGCPCLVSDQVGAKSLIAPSNGAVFEVGNETDFYEQLRNIMAQDKWDRSKDGGRPSLMKVNLQTCIDNLVEEMCADGK